MASPGRIDSCDDDDDDDVELILGPLKLKKLSYQEIMLLDKSKIIVDPDSQLLVNLKKFMLPDSERNRVYLRNMKGSRLAFECLTALTKNRTDEYCQLYYKKVIRPQLNAQAWREQRSSANTYLDPLNEYMAGQPAAQTNSMLRTIALCLTESCVDLKIFGTFSSSVWRRELLLAALFAKEDFWDRSLIPILLERIEYIIDLVESRRRHPNIENVLEYLLSNQGNDGFDMTFFLSTLDFIFIENNDEIAKYITNLPIIMLNDGNGYQAITLKWKSCYQLIMHHAKATVNFDFGYPQSYQTPTQHQLMNYLELYSYGTIRSSLYHLSNVEPDELVKVIQLLSLFGPTGISPIESEPFVYHLKEYNLPIWRSKFILFIIQRIMLREFPSYKPLKYSDDFERITVIRSHRSTNVSEILSSYRPWKSGLSISDTHYFEADIDKKNILQTSGDLNTLLNYLSEKLIRFMAQIPDDNLPRTMDIIMRLIGSLDCEKKIEKLGDCFEILRDYNFKIHDGQMPDIFFRSNCNDIENNVHDYVLFTTFPGTYQKNCEQLLRELAGLNNDLNTSNISGALRSVESFYDSISDWLSLEFLRWASERAKNATIPEVITVLTKAMNRTNTIDVREIQLISLILMLGPKENKGRLYQIDTGEGKSIIIAIYAAYLALMGNKVDIVTSSPVRAINGARDFQAFYKSLNLNVDHNIDNTAAYSCDIVYGTNLSYQSDILRSEFKRIKGRGDRPFDIVIVDEVDVMFIDGKDSLVGLSTKMPGMDELEPVLILVSFYVEYFATEYRRVCIREDLRDLSDSEMMKIYIIKNVTMTMEGHLRMDNRDRNSDDQFEEVKIPNHLREYVTRVQLNNWIRGAVEAKYGLQDDQQYMVRKRMITTVDIEKTSTIRYNSTWSDGFHQFVDIKNNKKLEPESLVSNFISNVGFFRRYNEILGLSGVLGNEHHRRLLRKIYNVDSILIPPFRQKQYKQLSPIIASKKEHWYARIIDSCLSKIRNGRAVLIITESIEEINALESKFNSADSTVKIKLYQTESDTGILQETLKPNEIIIATNLGVRVTDIKADLSTQMNGGIHVCFTYVPKNSRIIYQICSITSRIGDRGTGQFIILGNERQSIEEIFNDNNEAEIESLEEEQCEMRKVRTRDDIFQRFCVLLDSIESPNGTKEKDAVEERFAIWLIINEHVIDRGSFEEYNMAYEDFEESIKNGDRVKNPWLSVLAGNEKYLNEQIESLPVEPDDYKFAIDQYNLAIQLDEDNVECAYYNRAVAEFINASQNEQSSSLPKIVEDFKKARKIMMRKNECFDLFLHSSIYEMDLHTQFLHKKDLYNAYIKSIDILIGYDEDVLEKRHQKLIQLLYSTFEEKKKEDILREIDRLGKEQITYGTIRRIYKEARDCNVKFQEPHEYLENNPVFSYYEEIQQLKSKGWIPPVSITKSPEAQWLPVLIYSASGCVHTVTGILMMYFLKNWPVVLARALTMEGFIEFSRVVRQSLEKKNFGWKMYLLQKVFTFLVCIVISCIMFLCHHA